MNFASDRYERMPYRRAGQSGLLLPAISLGAYQTFGHYVSDEEAKRCLFRAFDLGITHFDLANNYGDPPGHAEEVVGEIIREMPRDELIISTKAGWRMWPGPYGEWLSKKYLVASLDQSLKRLGLEYVDVYYAHRPDPITPLEETMEALDLLVKQGKALYVGVSSFKGAHYERAVSITEQRHLAPITLHQPAYNLLNRSIETDLLDHTESRGTGVIVYAPLGGGRLTEKYLDRVEPDSRAAQVWGQSSQDQVMSEWTLQKVRALVQIARARGQSLAQMSISWILRLPQITSVLLGASRLEQLEENVRALENLSFTEEELRAIDEVTKG